MSNVTLSKGPYLIHIKDPFEVLHPVVEKLMKTQHETGFSFRQAASSGTKWLPLLSSSFSSFYVGVAHYLLRLSFVFLYISGYGCGFSCVRRVI